MTHELKTYPDPFSATLVGHKKHEVRIHDRPYAVGDRLHLMEWDPGPEEYTGRELIVAVTYKSEPGSWGLPDNLCVMSITFVEARL